MANWLRLPSGRLCNLDLIADIDHDVTCRQPWARATLAAGGAVSSDGMIDTVAVTLAYGGADARALIRHFCEQEVVRDAPTAKPGKAVAP
jgi:hypothetical protein